MIKIPIDEVERAFGIVLKRNNSAIGVDTASRTGLCLAKTNKNYLILDYSFLDITSANKYHKYNTLIDNLKDLFENNKAGCIVIEETFFSTNAKVFQFLSRIGGMAYTLAHILTVSDKYFISAVQARKALWLPCNKKKEIVHEDFHNKLPTVTIKDIDIIDAIVLAINGLMDNIGLL